MKINIIINEEEKTIDLLYNGYNLIAKTIYNKDLTNKILRFIENYLKENEIDFENLDKLLNWDD